MNKELGSDSRPYEAVSEMRGGFKIEVRKPQGYDHFEIYFPQTSKIINTGSGDSEEAKKVFKDACDYALTMLPTEVEDGKKLRSDQVDKIETKVIQYLELKGYSG